MAVRVSAQFVQVLTANATSAHRVELMYVENVGPGGAQVGGASAHRVETMYAELVGSPNLGKHRVEQSFVEIIGQPSSQAKHRVDQAYVEVMGSGGLLSHRVEQAYVEIIGDVFNTFSDTVPETLTAVETQSETHVLVPRGGGAPLLIYI